MYPEFLRLYPFGAHNINVNLEIAGPQTTLPKFLYIPYPCSLISLQPQMPSVSLLTH